MTKFPADLASSIEAICAENDLRSMSIMTIGTADVERWSVYVHWMDGEDMKVASGSAATPDEALDKAIDEAIRMRAIKDADGDEDDDAIDLAEAIQINRENNEA